MSLTTIAPGIYMRGRKVRVISAVMYRGKPYRHEDSFDLNEKTTDELQAHQTAIKGQLMAQAIQKAEDAEKNGDSPAGTPDTDRKLKEVVPDYFKLIRGLEYPKNRENETRAWLPKLGNFLIKDIDAKAIKLVVANWQNPETCFWCDSDKHVVRSADGSLRCAACLDRRGHPRVSKRLANDTINKRRTALMGLFNDMAGGREGINPVRGTKRKPPAPAMPRGQRLENVRKALVTMPDSKTKARCAVLAFTGMRPSSLKRLGYDDNDKFIGFDEDVKLDERVVFAKARKGGVWKAYPVPLNDEAIEAVKYFIAKEAHGPFSTSSAGQSWKRACKRAGIPVMRFYDLKHSFGTDLRRQGSDLADVAAQLGVTEAMAKRYSWVDQEKLQKAVARVNGDAGWKNHDVYQQSAPAVQRRIANGLNNGRTKLTETQVKAIRIGYGRGEAVTSLAKTYGVDRRNVWQIVRGITWKHVH